MAKEREMKLALYARVSKADSHQDPEVQLRELRSWCKERGHKIVAEYADRMSGKRENFSKRPQLNKLMNDALAGMHDIDAVLVWKLDRFGRSVPDLYSLVSKLREAKVEFISLRENFDLTTPMGKAFFGLLCVFAEFERDVTIERIHAGLRSARAKGHRPGPRIDPRKGPSRTTRWRQRKRAA